MRKRKIEVLGYEVEVWKFGSKTFYYPSFNGNAEFEVSSKGFRELSHYLRTVRWADNMIKNLPSPILFC